VAYWCHLGKTLRPTGSHRAALCGSGLLLSGDGRDRNSVIVPWRGPLGPCTVIGNYHQPGRRYQYAPDGGTRRVSVDQTLRCRDCGVDFIWTEGEQDFFASRGLTNPPSRCPSCRAARRQSGGGGGGGGGFGGSGGGGGGGYRSNGPRQMYEVPCAGCGGVARVPFQPRGDKPVYCSDCFRAAPR